MLLSKSLSTFQKDLFTFKSSPPITILTFLLSSLLSCLSEPLIHRAWTTAALLRGAVSENTNNSHQCLKASYTHKSWFQVNIQSLRNNCVGKKRDVWRWRLFLNETDLGNSDKLYLSLLFKIKKQNRYMQAWIVGVYRKSSQRQALRLQTRAQLQF